MNIASILPGIVPTLRDYEMGEWPQKRMKMRNGRIKKWGLANQSAGDKMALAWENITYTQAEQLVNTWDLNYGIYGRIVLPPETIAGTTGGLATLLATPFAGATWHFSGAPQVSAVKAGRCTVRMPIEARGYIGDGEPARAVSSGGYLAQSEWLPANCPVAGFSISVKYNYIDYRAAATACGNPSSTRAPQIVQQEIIIRDPKDLGYRLCGVRILEKYRFQWTETCQSVPTTFRDAGVQWRWENTWTAFRNTGGLGEALEGPVTSLWQTSLPLDPNYMLYDILEIKVDGQLLAPSELMPYYA